MQRFVVYCSWELIQSWSGRAGIRCLSLVGAHYIGPRPAPRSRSRGTGNRSVEAKSRLPTRPGTTGTAGQNNHGYALAVIWSNDTSCLSTAAEKPALTTVTCWALAALHKAVQCQFSVNWYQLVSDNSVSSWLSLPSDKSHLVIWFFKKNGFSAIGGADLGQELTTNSLPVRQKCSWICLIISFSSRCINPQALICTVRQCTLKSIKLCSGNRRWLPPVGGAEVPCAHVHLEQQRQPAPGRVAARSAHQDTQAHRLTDEQAQDRTAKSPRGCNFLFCVWPQQSTASFLFGGQGRVRKKPNTNCSQQRPATTQAR